MNGVMSGSDGNQSIIADAVCKYGYTDVPHLMREFKRYHSMNIREAREMALRYYPKEGNGC